METIAYLSFTVALHSVSANCFRSWQVVFVAETRSQRTTAFDLFGDYAFSDSCFRKIAFMRLPSRDSSNDISFSWNKEQTPSLFVELVLLSFMGGKSIFIYGTKRHQSCTVADDTVCGSVRLKVT
ncbi:unnamed protein product [Calypogeia fissa]